MKLESKYLTPYLSYGLKGKVDDYEIVKLIGIHHFNLNYGKPFNVIDGLENWSTTNFKPILSPLSDLTEDILGNFSYGFEIENYKNMLYKDVEKLLELHFDVFGLIEKGLAIDINTL